MMTNAATKGQSTESVERAAELSRVTGSYGRTDGRTNEETLAADDQVTDRIACARVSEIDGMVSLGEVIAAGELWRTDERHERVRVGERDPIPSHTRAAIWFRDKGRCEECPDDSPSGDALHLDHIKPWSAGGPDTSDNLRLLCERHNLERSNFIDYTRPKRPVTWWCANCYGREHEWEYLPGGFIVCPTHGHYSRACRVRRRYEKAFADDDVMLTWHQRDPLTTFDRIAYCAHCDVPAVTGVVL